ncbi:hypothetical protein P4S72_23495 [Vibrio sp. PP-XX7]
MFSSSFPIDNIDYHSLDVVLPPAAGNPVAQNGREYQWHQLPLTEADAEKWPKYYALTLAGNDFGHGDFSQVSQFIAYFNTINLQKMGPDDFQAVQVPEPYTPQLNALTLDYHSLNVIDAATLQDLASPALQFVHPIGRPRISGKLAVALLPRLPETAYLYLGLSQVRTPSEVRLYFPD